MQVRRGDIFIARLPEGIGSEQGGIRPVVVIQNDIGNRYSPLVIVAAVTGQRKQRMPTHVVLNEEGLAKPSLLLLESIYTIGKARLIKRIGTLSERTLAKMDKAAAISIGISPKYFTK